MKFVGNTINTMLKRPLIIIFFAAVVLTYLLIDRFNPVFTIVYGLTSMGRGDIFGSLVALLQLVFQPGIIFKGIIFIAAFIVLVSLLGGVLLSGCFNIIKSSVEKRPKTKHEFLKGIRKYSLKMCYVSFIVLALAVLLVVLVMVASVPGIIVTRAAAGKTGLTLVAILVDIITVAVLFFSLMFFRIYVFFWFPAIFSDEPRAFTTGKRMADSHFWGILPRIFALDVVFALSEILFLRTNTSIVFLAANWIFKTAFFSFYATYIFSLFEAYRQEKLEKQEKQELPS